MEVVCFLRATLMELTDIALLQASRRSQELFRHAAECVHQSCARSNGATLQQAVRARTVLRDETKSWRDRVLEARTLLDDISEARVTSFASQVRRALAEGSRRVHAHLAGLRDMTFAGRPGDLAYEQWQAWIKLQATGGREIPPDFKLPSATASSIANWFRIGSQTRLK